MINPYFLIQMQPLHKVLDLIAAHEELRALVIEQEPITIRTSLDTIPLPSSPTVQVEAA